jgi:hypothetical protein
LSGLAQSFQRKMTSRLYLAEPRVNNLPRALLWRTGLPKEGPIAHQLTSWRAPSWYFLSVDGNMSYESQRLFNGSGLRPKKALDDYRPTGLRVLDCSIHFTSSDVHGSMSEAQLLLREDIMQHEVRYRLTNNCKDCCTSTNLWHELQTDFDSITAVIGDKAIDMVLSLV